jgi:hypothetical protein
VPSGTRRVGAGPLCGRGHAQAGSAASFGGDQGSRGRPLKKLENTSSCQVFSVSCNHAESLDDAVRPSKNLQRTGPKVPSDFMRTLTHDAQQRTEGLRSTSERPNAC